jgi:hypothetical protein
MQSQDFKESERRARNREHARNSRAKKQKKLTRVDELEQENASLRHTIDIMRRQHYTYASYASYLLEQIALLRRDAEFLYVRPPSDVRDLVLDPVTDADLESV